MKHYFWYGLFVGCLSSLLAMGIAGAFVTAAAQSKNSDPTLELQSPPGSGFVAQAPQGGGGPGPVGTAFSYQGLLKKNGAPFNGSCDFRFALFDSSNGTAQIGPALNGPYIAVANGVFTTYLDFGDQFNGQGRYLETEVSCPAGPSPSFTKLPRQLLNATPYALSLRPGATISSTYTMPVLNIHAYSVGNTLSVINDLSDNFSDTIFARANAGTAVNGYAAAYSGYTVGVMGVTNSKDGYGVIAQGGGGAALGIAGGIKVFNAGIGSSTPVFIHKVNANPGGNLCSVQNYSTVIDNYLINNNPNAILIVTPNYGPDDATGVAPAVGIPAVYYDATNQCGKGAGKWVIYNLDSQAQVNNSLFNVMAVVP